MGTRKGTLIALCTTVFGLGGGASNHGECRVLPARSIAQHAYAAGYPTDSELVLLPDYCRARLRQEAVGEAQVQKWRDALGYRNFAHLHHYCQNLNRINRADRAPNQKSRQALLREALDGLRKVQGSFQRDFILHYEIYYHIGRAAARLDLPAEAVVALRDSIEMKPDYLPAYAVLSDVYQDNGQPEEALRVIEAGLGQAPTSKVLRQRKLELESASERKP